MGVIVTRWYVSWSNIWCCCSLSKVVVLSRITTTNRSTVLLLVPTAYLTLDRCAWKNKMSNLPPNHFRVDELSPKPKIRVVVATAGTTDLPVAEEAAVTLEAASCEVYRVYDAGVAGKSVLHEAASPLPPSE